MLAQTGTLSVAMRMSTVLLRISQNPAACERLISSSNSTASLCETMTHIASDAAEQAPGDVVGDLGQTRSILRTRLVLATALTMNNVLIEAAAAKPASGKGDDDAVGCLCLSWPRQVLRCVVETSAPPCAWCRWRRSHTALWASTACWHPL